jgi:hypothetical protein
MMKHAHDYGTISHPAPSQDARGIGIKSAEIRQCSKCRKVMPFVLIQDKWVPLFEDPESDDQDILLA